MKRNSVIISFLIFATGNLFGQTIPISQAHVAAVGDTVTVTGIVTNGSELGNIRYFQDATGGIAAYGTTMAPVLRADEITLTGIISNYNNLVEITPVLSFTVNGSGNPLPTPALISAVQMDEPFEAQLVQIDNVIFTNGGQTFAGSTNYNFTANGQPGQIRIGGGTNLVGTIIPTAAVNVVGILSQYQTTYQLLPRDLNDITTASNFFITSPPVQNNITTTGFDVNWITNLSSSTYIEYGLTPALELGVLNGTGGTTNHTVTISGGNASQIYYVKGVSVSGTDTAHSSVKIFITASNSSGWIKCYFDKTVDNSVATITNAIQLPGTIDDTVIAYIGRAQHSIDIALYNFDVTNISNIAAAINSAYTNGVTVRLIYNSSTVNPAIALLDPGIYTLPSPVGSQYGIMHNKFMVIDADSPNPNDAIVWTGSTNWNDNQINLDANNVIIIQDQSLARGYKLEFEEMWGSTTNVPNGTNAKFGPDKLDNTPHEYVIGGKRIECYFSPSDNVTQQILNTAASANTSLYFAVLSFTRQDIADEIANRAGLGAFVAGMMDDSSNGAGATFTTIAAQVGNRMMLYDHTLQPGILHHKYMIVDQDNTGSDPLVLTGSHNWSNSAQGKNDENIVIVHDASIANQYYQEFFKRFLTNGGLLGVNENNGPLTNYMLYPVPNNGNFYLQYNLKQNSTGKLLVHDETGKTIFEKTLAGKQGNNSITIDLKNVASGLYFVEMNFDGSSVTQKMIVE